MLTTVHTVICFVAIFLGIVAVAGLFKPTAPEPWTWLFLLAAALATGTGFLFPFHGVTPAFGTGIAATIVLVIVLLARYAYGLAGGWRRAYAIGIVVSEYLLVFVLIAQAFLKVPALSALGPTGPAFLIAQLVCLAVFVVIGYRAVRHAAMAAT